MELIHLFPFNNHFLVLQNHNAFDESDREHRQILFPPPPPPPPPPLALIFCQEEQKVVDLIVPTTIDFVYETIQPTTLDVQ